MAWKEQAIPSRAPSASGGARPIWLSAAIARENDYWAIVGIREPRRVFKRIKRFRTTRESVQMCSVVLCLIRIRKWFSLLGFLMNVVMEKLKMGK